MKFLLAIWKSCGMYYNLWGVIFLKNIIKRLYVYITRVRVDDVRFIAFGTLRNMGQGSKFLYQVHCTDNVKIADFVTINGPGTVIQSYSDCIEIGRFCSIATGTKIIGGNHNYTKNTSYFIWKNVFGSYCEDEVISKGPIIIKEDVWIGANVTVLSGVVIERGAVVAAGSVVTNNVEAYSIVGGVPAKFIKKRFTDKKIMELERSRWWEWTIEEIKSNSFFFRESLSLGKK